MTPGGGIVSLGKVLAPHFGVLGDFILGRHSAILPPAPSRSITPISQPWPGDSAGLMGKGFCIVSLKLQAPPNLHFSRWCSQPRSPPRDLQRPSKFSWGNRSWEEEEGERGIQIQGGFGVNGRNQERGPQELGAVSGAERKGGRNDAPSDWLCLIQTTLQELGAPGDRTPVSGPRFWVSGPWGPRLL